MPPKGGRASRTRALSRLYCGSCRPQVARFLFLAAALNTGHWLNGRAASPPRESPRRPRARARPRWEHGLWPRWISGPTCDWVRHRGIGVRFRQKKRARRGLGQGPGEHVHGALHRFTSNALAADLAPSSEDVVRGPSGAAPLARDRAAGRAPFEGPHSKGPSRRATVEGLRSKEPRNATPISGPRPRERFSLSPWNPTRARADPPGAPRASLRINAMQGPHQAVERCRAVAMTLASETSMSFPGKSLPALSGPFMPSPRNRGMSAWRRSRSA